MNSTPHSTYLLPLLLLLFWAVACQVSTKPSTMEELEAAYQQMLSGEQRIDVDSLKGMADLLGKAYLAEVDADTTAETAPDYLFKAATLYESSFMNPSYALKLYNRLLNNYPQSDWVPESLFKTAFIYHNVLQDMDKARDTFEQFIEQYPNHELAVSAQSEIDNLGISPDSMLKKILKEGE
ncbi:MAG: tetratricopeptide repeat protein [Bacteroidota bacterium]